METLVIGYFGLFVVLFGMLQEKATHEVELLWIFDTKSTCFPITYHHSLRCRRMHWDKVISVENHRIQFEIIWNFSVSVYFMQKFICHIYSSARQIIITKSFRIKWNWCAPFLPGFSFFLSRNGCMPAANDTRCKMQIRFHLWIKFCIIFLIASVSHVPFGKCSDHLKWAMRSEKNSAKLFALKKK